MQVETIWLSDDHIIYHWWYDEMHEEQAIAAELKDHDLLLMDVSIFDRAIEDIYFR